MKTYFELFGGRGIWLHGCQLGLRLLLQLPGLADRSRELRKLPVVEFVSPCEGIASGVIIFRDLCRGLTPDSHSFGAPHG